MRDFFVELRNRIERGTPTDMGDPGLPRSRRYPPLAPSEIESTERVLGFSLPPLVRRLYAEVGNGGYGPAYGLLGLSGGAVNEDGLDALRLYQAYREPDPEDPQWAWPKSLLPLGHLGCAMYACVDCSTREAAVTWFEPNPHDPGGPWSDSFFPWAPSLEAWLEAWLRGHDVFELFFSGDAGAV